MTGVAWMAPAMGLPPMEVAGLLASRMGGVIVLGWMAHFAIGVALALVYAGVFADLLRGPAFLRGALYGVLPWLVAQLVVMPVMGLGLFSGSAAMAAGSLAGHLVYGGVLGAIYGLSRAGAGVARHAHA